MLKYILACVLLLAVCVSSSEIDPATQWKKVSEAHPDDILNLVVAVKQVCDIGVRSDYIIGSM